MNRKSRFRYLITLSVFTIIINNVPAQDTHYWNLQYGTTSTLLGGVVIGSVSGLYLGGGSAILQGSLSAGLVIALGK